jgi:hypothetical protein
LTIFFLLIVIYKLQFEITQLLLFNFFYFFCFLLFLFSLSYFLYFYIYKKKKFCSFLFFFKRKQKLCVWLFLQIHGPSWSSSSESWIFNYLLYAINARLLPLTLWVRILHNIMWWRLLLTYVRSFRVVNKTDSHDIANII